MRLLLWEGLWAHCRSPKHCLHCPLRPGNNQARWISPDSSRHACYILLCLPHHHSNHMYQALLDTGGVANFITNQLVSELKVLDQPFSVTSELMTHTSPGYFSRSFIGLGVRHGTFIPESSQSSPFLLHFPTGDTSYLPGPGWSFQPRKASHITIILRHGHQPPVRLNTPHMCYHLSCRVQADGVLNCQGTGSAIHLPTHLFSFSWFLLCQAERWDTLPIYQLLSAEPDNHQGSTPYFAQQHSSGHAWSGGSSSLFPSTNAPRLFLLRSSLQKGFAVDPRRNPPSPKSSNQGLRLPNIFHISLFFFTTVSEKFEGCPSFL